MIPFDTKYPVFQKFQEKPLNISKPDRIEDSELIHSGQKSTLYDEKVNKRVKNRRNSFKNWSKNSFFVKTTYSQCAGNHSEHAIRSPMKFSLI